MAAIITKEEPVTAIVKTIPNSTLMLQNNPKSYLMMSQDNPQMVL